MKKIVANHLFVSIALALVIGGYLFGVAGLANLAAFFVGAVMLPIQILFLSPKSVTDTAKASGAAIKPPRVKRALAVAVICIAAWHGAFFTAAAMLACMLLGMVFTKMHNEEIERMQAEAAR